MDLRMFSALLFFIWPLQLSSCQGPPGPPPVELCNGEPCHRYATCTPDLRCVCTRRRCLRYRPLCGSDGETYPNICEFQLVMCQANTTDLKRLYNGICRQECRVSQVCPFSAECINGECVCDQKCPIEANLVCGSDGRTHRNLCFMKMTACSKKVNITVDYNGECKIPGGPTCAENCRFHSQCVNGECVCDQKCPIEANLVCGSDGRTHRNLCFMKMTACSKKVNITVDYNGECKIPVVEKCTEQCQFHSQCIDGKCSCVQNCSLVANPVCGSDGKTHGNLCLMKMAACNGRTNITVAYDGECKPGSPGCNSSRKCDYHGECVKGECTCGQNCSMISNPVCGSDGKTHRNLCAMKMEACATETNITVKHAGQCKPVSSSSCRFAKKRWRDKVQSPPSHR